MRKKGFIRKIVTLAVCAAMILTSAGLTGLDVFAADYNIWLVQCEKGAQSLRETGTKYEEKDGIIKVPTKDQFLAGLISNDTCSVRLKGGL